MNGPIAHHVLLFDIDHHAGNLIHLQPQPYTGCGKERGCSNWQSDFELDAWSGLISG
jgi:hypothetical protein